MNPKNFKQIDFIVNDEIVRTIKRTKRMDDDDWYDKYYDELYSLEDEYPGEKVSKAWLP